MRLPLVNTVSQQYIDKTSMRHGASVAGVVLTTLVLGVLTVSIVALIHVLGNRSTSGVNALSDAMGKDVLKGVSIGAGSAALLFGGLLTSFVLSVRAHIAKAPPVKESALGPVYFPNQTQDNVNLRQHDERIAAYLHKNTTDVQSAKTITVVLKNGSNEEETNYVCYDEPILKVALSRSISN